MEFQNDNGTATAKPGTATEQKNKSAQNGAAKTATATNGKEPAKTSEPPKAAEPKKEEPKAEAQPAKEEAKPELTLEAKLKAITDLNRKSVQRLALIGRIHELEDFEVSLISENDELESNPYQGCKLIIEDDKRRQFVTNTPNLIRMVSEFILVACEKKLAEIESAIVFPKA